MRNKLFLLILLPLLAVSSLLPQTLARPFAIILSQDDFQHTEPPPSTDASSADFDFDDFGYSTNRTEADLDPGTRRPLFGSPSAPPHSKLVLELNYDSSARSLLLAVDSKDLEAMKEAVIALEEAAMRSDPDAQSVLGFLYGSGQLKPRSEARAFLYHHFASLGGNMQSKMALAYRYYRRNMHEKAAELYAEVAEATLSSFLTSNDPLSEPVRIHKGTEKDTEALNKSKEDVDHFQKTEYLAQRGYAVMMYEIGTYYYFGLRSVKRDHERGLSWFLKAAERGEPRSMELLGEIYTRGAGVERNYEKAFEWFTLAANQHYASAYNGIGYLYIKGFGVEMKNYTKAKEYFQKAAENNDSGGHYNLGVLYLKGIGVKKDVRIACQFFIKAANAGQPKAFFQLAKMFHTGTGLKKNVGMATALYKLVAEWGPWSSLSRWALESYLKGEVGKAFLLYSRMAELGYEVAQSNAAWILEEHANHNICLEGSVFCTDTERYQRALALWWQASEQGSGHAALQIGKAYYEGRGTKRDFEQAAESYVHARLQSIAEARFELGLMHKQGHGLPLDLHLAKRYFGEARENEPSKLLVYKIISHLIDIYLLLLCKAIGAKVCIIVGSTAIVCLFTCYYRCRHGHRKRKDGTAVQRALQAIAEKRQQLAAEEQEQMAALMQQQEQMDAKKKRQKLQVQGAAGPKHRHQKH